MEDNTKKYWKGLEELSNDIEFVKLADQEFPFLSKTDSGSGKSDIPSDLGGSSRRDFLKMMGFGVAAVSLAACDTPVKKAIPYLNKPEDIEPGIANYYASTYVDSNGDYSSILVRTREGRPIKIEPNSLSSLTPTGTTTRAQASLLCLYDQERLKGATKGGQAADWKTVDSEITAKLGQIAAQGGAIRIVSSTIFSPSTKAAIADFIAKYPTAQHVVYDATSVSAVIKAHAATFGKSVTPTFDYSKANVMVSVGADFLGTWLNSALASAQYAQTRKLGKNKKEMSRHYQFESALSLTGANADYRTPIKPSQEGLVVASLYNKVARATGGTTIGVTELKLPYLDQAAKDLVNAKGKSLVVSGSNDVNVQILVNALNHLLGNYGTTLTIDRPSYLKQGDDAAMANFVKEVNDGAIQAVIFYNANPVYDYPTGSALADSLKKVGLKISFADRINETAAVVDYVCPDHNYLESWGDAEPIQGFFSVVQPTINPIFKTRHAQESLLTWAGINTDQYTYVKNYWRKNLFPQQTAFSSFESFWTQTLHDGVFEPGKGTAVAPSGTAFTGDLNAAFANISRLYKPESNTIELSLYEKVSIGNGDGANNPYLQEFPDPISRACWDNYLAVSKKMAGDMGLEQGDVVKIDAQGKPSVSVPVLIQPGQADGSVSLAVGYGREKAGKAANKVGKNAFTFASFNGTTISYVVPDVKITKTGEKRELAQVQTHHTIMARPVVQEAKLTAYQANPAAGRYKPKINTEQGPKKPGEITMWDEHSKTNHSWGMVIDLNSCTGCGACVVACNVENNIPVVGRQEVINRREMHWLRIDRYYSSDGTPENKNWTEYHKLEEASANPEVVFQPMLCQHCSNAPCETVCPVLATTHSFEGLNQMTYNRCIGTRYCANNCPYKVRRFNWFKYHDNEKFDYHMNNDLGKMVLNPDVTVRARGVMEKCSFCVQRIQEGKLNAKKERRRPKDGEIVTACAQSCATGAIVFGDMNDPESKVSQLIAEEHDKRAFQVLEEINVKPQISYLTKIRNKA